MPGKSGGPPVGNNTLPQDPTSTLGKTSRAYSVKADIGNTSRAFALTHGAEANMQPNPLQHLAAVSGVQNRGGAIPQAAPDPLAGYTPQTADLTQNPYGPAYDQLLNFVKQSMGVRGSQYDATKAQFMAQQEAANKGMYNAYLGSRQGADASATALHVDPAIVSATRDLMMRKNQENSDQSLADNLAWLDKSKVLEGSMLNTTSNSIAQEKAQKSAGWDTAEKARVDAQNLAALQKLIAASTKTSGGSGKKGKGGSKSSSGVTTTATDTGTLQFGGMDKAFYDQLVAEGNPEAAALYLNQHILNSGSPELKATQTKINELAGKPQPSVNKVVNRPNVPPGPHSRTPAQQTSFNIQQAAATKTAQQKKQYQKLLPGMLGYSGIMGNPKSVQTVKNTSKAK